MADESESTTLKAVLEQVHNATTTVAAKDEAAENDIDLEVLVANVDSFFLIVMGCIVFLMQCGFAFLEAGCVRSKNTVNILIKNMLDAFIAGVSYWAIGYALAYGDPGNVFCGEYYFFSYGMEKGQWPFWFFQYVFAATAATIVSGSVAERCHFIGYFVYSSIITGWVYPIVTHWAWTEAGWLSKLGYSDFAGSGVVHLLGATCALVGCVMIGSRRGRFTKDGKPIDMAGHSVPFAALGGFILLFGFLAFNGGSQLAITNKGDSEVVGLAIVNTIMGGCSGGLTVLFSIKLIFGRKWSYLMTLNGALTGMVAQCAGCNLFEPWAALIVGVFGGIAFIAVHEAMLKMRLDDPLDAVAVHGGGGLVGVIAQPFFAFENGIFWTSAGWHSLGVNIAGLLAIFAWSGFWSMVIFGGLKAINILRIDRDTEFRGNDTVKHGEAAYPVDAWVELQYDQKRNRKISTSSNQGASAATSGPMFQGTTGSNKASFNNAMEMVPTAGTLFQQLSNNFGGFNGEVGPQKADNPDGEDKKTTTKD